MSEVVEHFPEPGGRQRVTIYKRADGLFECSFDKFYVDDLPEYKHHKEYWATVHRWGIFDSVATARREASTEFPWLHDSENTEGS